MVHSTEKETHVTEMPQNSSRDDLESPKEAGFIEDSEVKGYVDPGLQLEEAENKRLLRKIHWHLLPVMCIAYIAQSLDKGTLGTSSIMGWQKDVGAKGQDYALTSTFLWAGVIVGEPIINQLNRRFPIAKVLGFSMCMWTALVFALGFTKNVSGVWAIRFFLGMFEAAFAPCLLAITVQWYHKKEQAMVTTVWQAAYALASGFSSLMGYAFINVKNSPGNLHGWQWLHILVGILSASSAAIILIFLPDSPTKVKWATEEEKVKFVERVRENDQGVQAKRFKSDQVRDALTDPLSWLLVLMILLQTLVNGGIYTFNAILINKAFGFDAATAQLLGIPLNAFTVMLYFLIGWAVTKTRQTIYCIIAALFVNLIGTIVLITVAPTPTTRGGLLVAFYLMQCIQAINPSCYSLLSLNVAGQTKKSIVYALFFVAWAGGNATGPQLFQAKWAPRYFNTLYIHIGLYIAMTITLLVMRLVIVRRNAERDAQLVGENVHARAFEDKTDRQNPEFRYSY
ncbi:MFS general substrate transporter [Aaosphaeria arxii CBS 175.79]|uniref:MFS general substrate transporter n=1 Tax=Aaosphaeria arxii CBS 175.79 TaxID=1450172 RepID=A0A6A5X6S0_9PLEO|nr:MFS general substrate transporter [Aaosphaeria arxii CBS 175.79]KAF2008629.1 MFS general substrate transporter [Aaosphaeria arxii CBS 175.79]